MEKNTIVGFILIGLVLMIWLWLSAPPPPQPQQYADSAMTRKAGVDTGKTSKETEPQRLEKSGGQSLGRYFTHLKEGEKKSIHVETDLYRAQITTEGGSIRSWELTKYLTWDKKPVNLINTSKGGEFHLLFNTSDGKFINTKGLIYKSKFNDGQIVRIAENDSFTVSLEMIVDDRSKIIKNIIFYGGKYSFDVSYQFIGMEQILSNFSYEVVWESGLRYAEKNSVDESQYAKASAYVGGEVPEIDATSFTESVVNENISGRTAWVSTRTKYFAVAIMPRGKESQRAYLAGNRIKLPDEGFKENYNVALEMPFTGQQVEKDRFTIFLGPLEFDVVKEYNVGLEKMVSLGAAWIIRPISEYVIIPLFQFLKIFIPNYGLVLIVFSLIIKIALHPLTKTSMKSMQKMQALQPMINEIREKQKGDPQKMNQQIMRLYKEYGVNPAGGCLPLLLQLPILYALWAVFSSAIQLRQASFIWWINDLSAPDVIAKLPFRLPIFNIDEISGLALLMGITMFIQQKMTIKDPRQKMMVWLMPLFLTIMFNGFPSGLNLYYFTFNILSIAQQAWVNKQHKDEPLRKIDPKKSSGGLISRIAKDLPRSKH